MTLANEKMGDHAAMAMQRTIVYGLLAEVYRREVTPEFLQEMKDPQFLGVLQNLGIDWEGDLLEKPVEGLLEDLSVEYARLFLGPGKHISPHESVHHQRADGQWGQLWGKSTVEVRKFIEAAGLSYETEYQGIPDNISVELEFMQKLIEREAQALAENDEESVLKCRKIEKRFMEEHLIQWVPRFCDQVAQEAESPFYRDMAVLTKNFIAFDRKEVDASENEDK